MKIILPDRVDNIVAVSAFMEEIKLMTLLNHPHIVSFIGVAWRTFKELKVLTEFMIHGTVRSYLDIHPAVTWQERTLWAMHVAEALVYLHSNMPSPIIHRDLKASNVLLNEELCAKVSDFGISRVLEEDVMTCEVLVTFKSIYIYIYPWICTSLCMCVCGGGVCLCIILYRTKQMSHGPYQ